MTTTLEIGAPANFSANTVQPPFPNIVNLRTLAFFGTMSDASNRVAGGPAIVVAAGSPVSATNYVNLGVQPGTVYTALDTQNPRDAAMLAGGCTWVAAFRISQAVVGSTLRAMIFGDYKVGGAAISGSWSASVSGQKSVQITVGSTQRAAITCVSDPISAYHFVAMTYSGGAAGTFTLYDYTENATTGVPVTYVTSGQIAGTQTPHFGQVASNENIQTQPIEQAFGLIAASVMNATDLATLYAWVKANLARRSIII